MTLRPVSRRSLLGSAGGIAAGALVAGELLTARRPAGAAPRGATEVAGPGASGYVPDGMAGLAAAFPLAAVALLDIAFHGNQARNTSYLLFVDPDRLLHTLRSTTACGRPPGAAAGGRRRFPGRAGTPPGTSCQR